MSQKKARLNRARSLAKQMRAVVISSEMSKSIMAHLLWSVPTDEMRAHFTGVGPITTIRLVDATGQGGGPELTIEVATQDALTLLSADIDDDMIEAVADEYHEFLDVLFPDDLIATVSVDREDGSGPRIVITVRPEDYITT